MMLDAIGKVPSLSLTITASADVIARVIAVLGGDSEKAVMSAPAPSTGTPTMPDPLTGAPYGLPTPTPAMPAQPAAGDDDETGAPAPDAPAFDSTGLPWDARIHAATKARTEAGAWRKRRGVDAALVTAVEAELRAGGNGPAVTAPTMPTMPAPVPVMQPTVAAPAMPPAPPMPTPEPIAAPPAPVAPAMPQPAAEADPFMAFMQTLSGKMTERDAAGAPLIDLGYLQGIINEVNTAWVGHGVQLGVITDLQQYPQVIPYATQLLQRDGKW